MQSFLISQLAKFLTGVLFWQQVRDAVRMYDDTTMTGAEKKEAVMKFLRAEAKAFGTFLVSLAIELGVAYFKSKSGKLK